ncbi:MAG: DNA-binding protein, partial [Halobacteriaceae archaeon]
MYESTLQVGHDSPYANITETGDIQIEVWCNQYCDLIHLIGTDLSTSIETIEAVVGVEDIVFKNDEAVLITNSCLLEFQDNLLEKYLKQYNCLSLPPLTYRDGTLFARVIALSEQQLTKVYHDLNDEHPV